MSEALVSDYMSSDVETARADEPLRAALERMAARRCSCTVVCEDARPIGIVTERDLGRLVLQEDRASRLDAPVAASMTRGIVAVERTATVAHAARVLRERAIRRLPVVDASGAVCGILTQSDLLRAFAAEAEERSEALEVLVAERTRELEEANQRLEALSLTDGLLGIGNRRSMELHLTNLHQIAGRYGKSYAMLMVDVDSFKLFNDRYGHLAADGVLRSVAQTAESLLRAPDRAFRYGGEELALALPETCSEGAMRAAERVRGGIEALGIEHEASHAGVVTVSIGVAVAREEGVRFPEAWSDLIARADTALYVAKESGRNRAVLWTPGLGRGAEC
ncbi:MAG: GGDEF domain-containing protein [Myxococcota bacterium]|nr:GGDEF domain-containing protein [Myxococcales bacterium]